ncbi:MAG TPA: DinB family protein [Anaerolineales bacterium]|nr:DinB family protein [Anaerolineales bacterium]
MMDPHRKFWNQQQQLLRQSLARLDDLPKTIELFMCQHAMLHSADISRMGLWSFEDEVLEGLSEQQIRLVPAGAEHSIAWVVWHMTRIEDTTMNLLAAGSPQILTQEGWLERMGIPEQDTGNAMDPAGITDLSAAIHLPALQAYRRSVGRRTRTIVRQLQVPELKRKVDPARLEQMRKDGVVRAEAAGLLEYWGGLTISGLLLMPPTRHGFVHWNEAQRIRQKIR